MLGVLKLLSGRATKSDFLVGWDPLNVFSALYTGFLTGHNQPMCLYQIPGGGGGGGGGITER